MRSGLDEVAGWVLLTVFGWSVARGGQAATVPGPAPHRFQAQWIWQRGAEVHAYNQTVIARKTFRLESQPVTATMRITADSAYRLVLNNMWVNDGPCRSWPEHYQYDEIDVTSYLKPGPNEIRVIARYYGVGDFHRIPQQAGLLAELSLGLPGGKQRVVATDGSWQVASAPAWVANTPKVSIQMEPAELYDARLESGAKFRKAAVLFPAEGGPWRDLNPRDVALMTRQPFELRRFLGAKVVQARGWNFCFPAARLVNPGVIEANHTVSGACGLATVLDVKTATTVRLQADGVKLALDGQRNDKNEFQLAPGRHLLLAFVREVCGHEKEKAVRFLEPEGFELVNPAAPAQTNPWAFIRLAEFAFVTNDLRWIGFRNEDARVTSIIDRYHAVTEEYLGSVRDEAGLRARLGNRLEVMACEDLFLADPSWQFQHRRVVGDASAWVSHPEGLLYNNADHTVIRPGANGDLELLYDLGEQNCGYYYFDLVADAGVEVDVFGVEYIAPDGRIQHSSGNRNGMRYITRQGVNQFTSLKRRSGRYLFVTFRNVRTPVQVRHLTLIESTYPVHAVGEFACSDARLDKIWEISNRTLKLCMEDTYTDCPLYEQTHWVGDARNESLLAFGVFGATDLARRCIQITAQSLERYPIAGCQTPSSWDCLLPAWSFLWGISTWDYYWYTGDKAFLRQIYPQVIRNLQGAERFVGDRDLFSGPFWNMFDWTGADQGPKTVVHNSMFLVGAIDAALKAGTVLEDPTHRAWLETFRARLVRGLNQLWDPAKQAYPDSIRDDGSISPSTCQHTSFLSLLYDIAEPSNREAAKRNLFEPPAAMVKIGSPFAMLYLYETFEKLGLEDDIIRETYRHYLPMVESGATTVWESFPSGTTGAGGFPTRSHCHAWSSAPSRFLPRILLGVKETAAGGEAMTISPRLNDLTWARGTVVTARGPVRVAWKREGQKLTLDYSVPEGVRARFVPNSTLDGLTLVVNGNAAIGGRD